MIKQIIDQFLRRTHFWRDVGFDELSELYVSNLLRSVAVTIFMVFVPFYMYQNGYSPAEIFALFGLFFVVRSIFDILGGYSVALHGPKHTLIGSCILQIVSAALLLTVPYCHWPIYLIAIPWGAANSLFFIAYHVTFSKIKHTKKAGHELGYMQVFEKVGYFIGPLIGGILGSAFGSQYIFIAAVILLTASLWPLFLTSEPVKVHQKLDFKNFPVNKIKYVLLSNSFMGTENSLCINIWPFYVAVFVLSGAVYAQLGALSAIGVLAGIASAKIIGKLSDTSFARPLLRYSAILNALMYGIRPFVHGLGGVVAVNVANEALTAGYRMPYTKGLYATADDLPGYRIVYVSVVECSNSISKAVLWFFLAILVTAIALKTVIFLAFVIAALSSLGIMTERFKVYNSK